MDKYKSMIKQLAIAIGIMIVLSIIIAVMRRYETFVVGRLGIVPTAGKRDPYSLL